VTFISPTGEEILMYTELSTHMWGKGRVQ